MRRRSGAALGAAIAAAATLACGGGGDSTGASGVVQLVSVTTNVLTVSCGRINHLASPDSLYLSTHLVNTTQHDVSVDSIGSTGTIIRATDQTLVGQGALNYTSLPYHPSPAVLQARTGDVTLTVALPSAAACASNSAALDFKDVSIGVRVTTDVGQYVSIPLLVHFVFN